MLPGDPAPPLSRCLALIRARSAAAPHLPACLTVLADLDPELHGQAIAWASEERRAEEVQTLPGSKPATGSAVDISAPSI
jgi:hypothetical protein